MSILLLRDQNYRKPKPNENNLIIKKFYEPIKFGSSKIILSVLTEL